MNYCHFPPRCPRLRLRGGGEILPALLLVEGADEFHGHLAKPGKRWGNPEGNDGKMGEKTWNTLNKWKEMGKLWKHMGKMAETQFFERKNPLATGHV